MKPKAKNILLIIITALTAWLVIGRNPPQSLVSITDQGFEPKLVGIKAGTKVIFKNTGELQHWPASNFHPTHTLYPEKGGCIGSLLDACRGLKTDESYAFKFDLPGEWPMHDHLFPGLTMVVRVGGDEVGVEYSREYSQELKTIQDLSDKDPPAAWQYLKKNFLINGEAQSNVHEFAHVVGNALYSSQGIAGASVCDPSFSFGCFHGVTEKMLQEEGKTALREIEDKCGSIFSGQFQKFASCIHGTGHGLVSWENLNIKAALVDCEALASPNQTYCWDGVFMEYMSSAISKPNDWQFCESLQEKYQAGCGRYMVWQFPNPVQSCKEAPNETLSEICFEAVGFKLAQSSLGDYQAIEKGCGLLKLLGGGRTSCLISASREVIFQAYASWQETSQKICDSLEDVGRERCLASNRETIKNYD